MPYVNNPSVPSLSSSVDPSVKSAIQYLTNYLTKFNNTLGTSLGNYNIGSTGTLVTSIPDGSIPESKLTINLNNRIDLIDTPDVGLVDSLFRLEVLQPTVFIQELEPTALAMSDIWVHPVSRVSKRWSGAEWLAISPQPNIELISVDPPMTPAQGDIWIKIVDEDLKQYTWYTWLTDSWQPYDPASALYINSIAVNANTTNIAAVTAINNVSATSDSANARALYTTKSAVEHPTTGLTSKASITDLSTANSTLATAVASSIVQTSTTLNGQTSTIEAMAESVDGVKAQYTVKLNAKDKVAGFGLMLDEGTPSTFEILADKFAIVHSDGVNSTSPFTVQNDQVYVSNGISSNYVQGISGWKISSDGNAEFNDVNIRGTVEAKALATPYAVLGFLTMLNPNYFYHALEKQIDIVVDPTRPNICFVEFDISFEQLASVFGHAVSVGIQVIDSANRILRYSTPYYSGSYDTTWTTSYNIGIPLLSNYKISTETHAQRIHSYKFIKRLDLRQAPNGYFDPSTNVYIPTGGSTTATLPLRAVVICQTTSTDDPSFYGVTLRATQVYPI